MRVKQIGAALAALAMVGSGPGFSAASAQGAVARADVGAFVGYETFRSATLSPDGKFVAGILRDNDGDLLIVHDRTTKVTKPIQRARSDQNLELTFVQFKGDDRLIFGLQQKFQIVQGKGSRSTKTPDPTDLGFSYTSRIFTSDLNGGDLKSLYDPSGEQGFPRWVTAAIQEILPEDPKHVLLRTPSTGGSQLRKVNLKTGKSSILETGSQDTINFVLDNQKKPVLREDSVAGGKGTAWLRRDAKGKWIEIVRFRGEERANGAPDFQGLGRGPRAGTAIVSGRPNGRDTNGLYVYDAATGNYAEPIYENEMFDVFNVMRNPSNGQIVGACYEGFQWQCVPSDPVFASHWQGIEDAIGEDANVYLSSGGSLNGSFMVMVDGPKEPGAYFIYDSMGRALERFQSTRRDVDPDLLPSKMVFDYKAADGTDMWGYVWLPPGATSETRNLPTIVLPHGGPESRDGWGGDPMAGYWSSQGYAVFQPHFRGGSGTGRKWVEAGHGQWGQLIQEDINDGTRALIAAGHADGNRVCVAGWSHGGYVAFTASYRDTELYKCSLAGAGVSDLRAMQAWVRKEQGGTQSISYKYWAGAIGDPNADAAKLNRYSANQNADKVGMPLLIVHGELDVTVPIEQSEMMVASLKKAGKPYEYIELKGMDHFLRRDQGDDWVQILTKGKDFFDKHIGPGWTP
jgi:dipeptidyl aminopeptidase/acylaminoacyl peptidase